MQVLLRLFRNLHAKERKMGTIDDRILQFVEEHHVLTLATEQNGQPYCCSCFYVFLPDENSFVFTSDIETRHAKEALANSRVAASIVLETKTIGKIQGLQITGMLSQDDSSERGKRGKKKYLKAFPFAVLKPASLWILDAEFMKMTDNRLGFGKKLIWERPKG